MVPESNVKTNTVCRWEAGRAHTTTAHRDNPTAASAQDTRGETAATSTDTGAAEASTETAATKLGGDASIITNA